ncbi:MAG: LysE family transporter [Anaerolineales bacterium]|nr:MAG: LysE family transporter [Anaerolineales bacterium]
MFGLSVFLKGIVLGFSIAAPVGPIGVLCIRISISEGRLKGFVSGMGAASADAVYGLIASLGLTASAQFLIDQSQWVRLVGGFMLGYLGIKTIVKDARLDVSHSSTPGLIKTYLSTLLLTLTNPLTIISFAAIFASLGVVERGSDFISASLLVVGVFLGSASWWFILSWGASLLGSRINKRTFKWINSVAGFILLFFAIVAIYSGSVTIIGL